MSGQSSKASIRSSVVVMSLVASFFIALFRTMDNVTMHSFILADDPVVAVLAYLVVGGWTGVLVGISLASTVGRLVDPNFRGISFSNNVMHWRAGLAGLAGAASTMFVLWGNQFGDPSGIIALANTTLVYTLAFELLTKKLSFGRIATPTILVFLGSSLAAFTGSVIVTLWGFLLVAVFSNGFGAVGELIEQKGVQVSDGVNMYLWRFLWLAASGTVLAFVITSLTGQVPHLLTTMSLALRYVWWIVLLMICVFFGMGLKLTLKKDNSVSVILLATTAQVVLGFPLTWFGDLVSPGIFGPIPTDLTTWLVKIGGAALLLVGLMKLRKLESSLKLSQGGNK